MIASAPDTPASLRIAVSNASPYKMVFRFESLDETDLVFSRLLSIILQLISG